MTTAAKALRDVRAYLAALPPGKRRILKKLRADIRAAAPGAVEGFSYRIPGFRLDDRPLVWYAAFKAHFSLYPIGAAIVKANAAALKGHKTSTGTVQFSYEKPPSSALVKRLVRARVTQVRTRRK
jgi:uncharacterized protein YdhG (YjbR/CyaY superfamily)